ncbi:hypothetical protein ACFY9Q_01180 [Streptomyces sp. NPDC012389]|uniref:hypothetical protein n=1 Tax=Streptomyces sp. NPDC012389 TaxID=3364830 RepID=UPI0036EE2A04
MALDMNAPSFKLWHTLLGHGVTEEHATELMNGYAAEVISQHEEQGEEPAPAATPPQ